MKTKRSTMVPSTLLLLALAACSTNNLPAAYAQQTLSGAPAALSHDEQCTDGNCADEQQEEQHSSYDYDDEVGDSDDFSHLSNDELVEKTIQWSIPVLKAYIKQYIHPEFDPTHDAATTEFHEAVTEPLRHSLLHKHMERNFITKTYPRRLETTLSRAGNYTDGTKAGTPEWLGDEGAQVAANPTYVSFGSVLDISTSKATFTNINDDGESSSIMIPWLASLVHRRDIVRLNDRSDENENKPCRFDFLDDYDNVEEDVCMTGVTLDEFTSVRSTERVRRRDMMHAARLGIADRGTFEVAPNILEFLENDNGMGKFDTIFADGVIAAVDDHEVTEGVVVPPMQDMDLVIEKLVTFLKPGGTLYLVGRGPFQMNEYVVDTPGEVYHEVLNLLHAVKNIAGTYPKKDLPASWVHRTVNRLGLNIVSSTLFPTHQSYYDMTDTIGEIKEWVDELPQGHRMRGGVSVYQLLIDLHDKIEEYVGDDEAYSGQNEYVITAELPLDSSTPQAFPVVAAPTDYTTMQRTYKIGKRPSIEELHLPPLASGELHTHVWANGDAYDGVSARIGIPDTLVPAITEYVKKLGLWDLMIDTITKNPMPMDTTRFYTVKSPYGNGEREFAWSAKRPDNFYGSDSDMHWFDIADEAAHEDSLRALSEGGFDEVLNAIGTHLGLDHLVTFSIGLLAVTKADKGYIHVDFQNSRKKAFNFLVNLETPGDDPELTIVEEDDIGNRRRGQIKYAPDFGVLNGDDAMHATNECNHRASGGVRITASIFIAELVEESLQQVASHDKYYFPFGNMEWIWAQRGRHWNKEGTVSMVEDKGRVPFEAKDELEGCEERVGKNKEKCLEHGDERMLCYKTCGAFMADDDFHPGEERRKVLGW